MAALTDRGAVVEEPGRLALETIELAPPGPHDVVVRIEASGVCHTDLHVLERGWAHPLPALLGHEAAGVVEDVGAGVTHVSVGDRVVLGWRAPCGSCRWCERGDARRCRTPAVAGSAPTLADGRALTPTLGLGALATRVVVHERAAVPVAADLPAEQACLIGCAVATGVGSVFETARVWEGARVAVIGCGAVGLCVVQGCRVAGAAEIWAVDVDARKSAAAQAMGATHVGEGKRLDFVFDVVGRPETFERGLAMLGHAGTLVYVGIPARGWQAQIDLTHLFDRRLKVVVSHGGDHVPAEDFPRFAQLVLDGRLDLAGMITQTLPLEEVERAFADLRGGRVVRSVVLP